MTTSGNKLYQRFEAARSKLAILACIKADQACALFGKQYHIAKVAPSNLVEMRAAWGKLSYPIYDQGNINTVYYLQAHNHAFRFWHDVLHLTHNLDVTFEDELTISEMHAKEAREYGTDAALLMRIDTRGQSEYYKEHGAFPEDQLAFAWAKWQELA